MSEKFNIVPYQAASGLPLTADFIVNTLGVQPDETDKRAKFWNRDKYGLIIGRLQNHLNSKAAANPCAETAQRPKKEEEAAPAPATANSGASDPFKDDNDDLFSEGKPADKGADDLFGESNETEDLFA